MVKELIVQDQTDNVCVSMSNEMAEQCHTKTKKRSHVKNSMVEYSPYKKRMVININEVDAFEVCTSFSEIMLNVNVNN